MADLNITLEQFKTELSDIKSELKSLLKLVRKMRTKQEDPTGEKAKARATNNGFNRPIEVSEELKTFLNLAEGEVVSRSEVTRRINRYITENNLKHPDNGRVIILDEKLQALLKPGDGIQVTFLNVQKYISPHYVKVVSTEEPIAATKTIEPVVPSTPKKAATTTGVKRPAVKKA
jgi:upstream activation factor subunit UAF30